MYPLPHQQEVLDYLTAQERTEKPASSILINWGRRVGKTSLVEFLNPSKLVCIVSSRIMVPTIPEGILTYTREEFINIRGSRNCRDRIVFVDDIDNMLIDGWNMLGGLLTINEPKMLIATCSTDESSLVRSLSGVVHKEFNFPLLNGFVFPYVEV